MTADMAATIHGIEFYATICVAAFLVLLALLRKDRNSFGLPAAYLAALLLIHLPGAFVQVIGANATSGTNSVLSPAIYTDIGLQFAAAGMICFVIGVWLSRAAIPGTTISEIAHQPRFWLFCLIGGWVVYYGLAAPLQQVSSLGAAVHEAAGVWMLGVMLGLAFAVERGHWKNSFLWFAALATFPAFGLIHGGFLSYGAHAAIIVLAILTVSAKKLSRVLIAIPAVVFVGLTFFGNYMLHRNDIRAVVWGGASLSQRVDAAAKIFDNFQFFDASNPLVLYAVDSRLNQNYFVGLAADRIRHHQTDYLYGETIGDALTALVPRAIWPDKPVAAGSGDIVVNATGLDLDARTSWGVGNVMEFQINFGWPGVIIGFLLLGLAIGALDRKAATAYAQGDLGRTILFFLPCTALIDVQGSLVEVTSGVAAALVAAYGWKWAWGQWDAQQALREARRA